MGQLPVTKCVTIVLVTLGIFSGTSSNVIAVDFALISFIQRKTSLDI